MFLGNQPSTFGGSVFYNVKEGFKITVLPTATGFGKPEPYDGELSWIWVSDFHCTYEVVADNLNWL
jgi:hypothetical protein